MRAFLLPLVLFCGTTWACGYCVEDKIAATYDHAVVTQALAKKHHVVFFHVEGSPERRVLERAVYAAGADRGSARISADRLTVSFAFDPARTRLAAVQDRIEKRLGTVSLLPLQVMERPGDMKVVEAR